MKIRSLKKDYKKYQPKEHEAERSLHVSSWQGDGTECNLQFEMEGRTYTLKLTRPEAVKVKLSIENFIQATKKEVANG